MAATSTTCWPSPPSSQEMRFTVSSEDGSIEGAACEVFPDFQNNRVVSRFLHPQTGEVVMELHLEPDVARDYAFESTRASIALEEYQKRH